MGIGTCESLPSFFSLLCLGLGYADWTWGYRHLSAQYDRVLELKAIVDMVGEHCLDVKNLEGQLPYEVAAVNTAWNVVSYIERVKNLPSGSAWFL